MKKPFIWGNDLSSEFVNYVSKEIWEDKIYEQIDVVKENDVVVDVGASCGVFAYSILDKKPNHVYCFEPSTNFFSLLKTNMDYENVTCINKAIIGKVHDKSQCILFWDENQTDFQTITFQDFLVEYGINKIDFMKLDCEGGEYNIFDDENIEFLKNNVRHIACEIHFVEHQNRYNYKYVNFLNKYLTQFPKYKVFTQGGTEITNEIFINHEKIGYENGQLIVYISNE